MATFWGADSVIVFVMASAIMGIAIGFIMGMGFGRAQAQKDLEKTK